MEQDLLYKILMVVVQAAIVVLGGYLIRYLKAKIGLENLNRYLSVVKYIVKGVEQVFGSGNGPDKKAEAVQLIKKLLGSRLNDDQINTLVESAVFEMNNLLRNHGMISE